MLRTRREDGAFMRENPAAYHINRWDDDTGNSEIIDYDQFDRPIRRFLVVHDHTHWAGSGLPRGIIEYDADGREVQRRPFSEGG